MFPPLKCGWTCDFGGSGAIWLQRLGHKEQYSFFLFPSGCLCLELSIHVVRKPKLAVIEKLHGATHTSQGQLSTKAQPVLTARKVSVQAFWWFSPLSSLLELLHLPKWGPKVMKQRQDTLTLLLPNPRLPELVSPQLRSTLLYVSEVWGGCYAEVDNQTLGHLSINIQPLLGGKQ